MKKQLLLHLLIIIVSPTVFAQTVQKIWSKKYLNTSNASSYFYTNKSIADNDGNLLVTAENGLELEILKLDTAGNLLWKFAHRYYTTLNRTLHFCAIYDNYEYNYITVDGNNNIYVSYYTDDSLSANSRWCIMKISPSGTLVWDKMYEGAYGDAAYPVAIKVDANSNVYATGIGSNPLDTYDNLILTIKLNSSGVLQWEKTLDGNAIDGNLSSSVNVGCDLLLDNNANVYVTGQLSNYDSTQHYDLVLAKYTSAGTLAWSKVVNFGIEFARDQQGRRIFLNNNNEIIVCGYSADTLNFTNTILLMKYDVSGNEIWRKILRKEFNGFLYGNSLSDITLDNSGNIITATKTGNFGSIGLVTKFSGVTGDTLWTYRKDEYSNWQPTGVKTDNNNFVYAWGMEDYYQQQLPYKRAWLIVFDPSGNQVTSIVDSTVTYVFNDLNTRSIVRVNNSIYCFAHFNDDIAPQMNGLAVKFSAPSGTPTAVTEIGPSGFDVFPNPFSNNFIVSVQEKENTATTICIYNVEGKEMLHDVITGNTLQVDASAWQAGIYFVNVLSETQTQSFKLIKN